jgi:hypothetical protein
MGELSRLADMAEILGAAIVIGGVFFAILQMRQIRQQRRELAAIELFRFYGSPDFAQAYNRVLKLPDGLSNAGLRQNHADAEACAMLISTTMENIGVMVFHRIVPSVVVSNLLGTSAIILWRKLRPWIEDLRDDVGNPSAFEWFEWLATMLQKHEDSNALPAYEAHLNWKPTRDANEI